MQDGFDSDAQETQKALHGQYDKTRRLLYSHPRMVEDTLRFIDEPWVDELDFSTLERMPDSHVSERLHLRFEDVVWKVRWKDSEVYLCLLLEFQSKVEPYMVFRVFFYMAAFYMDLVRQIQKAEETPDVLTSGPAGERPAKLPLVIPIVSYNGRAVWWPSCELRDYIACPEPWLSLAPDFRMLLLDQQRIPEKKLQDLRKNAMSVLTVLESSESPEELFAKLTDLVTIIVDLGLERAMGAAIKAMLMNLGVHEKEIPESDKLLGSGGMLMENMLEWKKNFTADALQQGRKEGESLVLQSLLESKFGQPLPEDALERIQKADADTLVHWALKVLSAKNLQEVFENG